MRVGTVSPCEKKKIRAVATSVRLCQENFSWMVVRATDAVRQLHPYHLRASSRSSARNSRAHKAHFAVCARLVAVHQRRALRPREGASRRRKRRCEQNGLFVDRLSGCHLYLAYITLGEPWRGRGPRARCV